MPLGGDGGAPYLRIEGVTKRFAGHTAVNNVSLDIGRGEFFALLGPSGCGKTTLLRMLAGFERPDSGAILIDGQDMAPVPPYLRPVNMMFQSYALFPHMTVESNVGFGLRQDKRPRDEIADRVSKVLELVHMGRHAKRKPGQLSGGERQRVALARALVKEPKLLLLDEPMAALDRKLREDTRFELVRIQNRVGITFIMVTHDQEEAMTTASRVAVMQSGNIVQVGTPREVYEQPATRFVADFIGAVNLFDGKVAEARDGTVSVVVDGLPTPIQAQGAPLPTGTAVSLAVRPEKIALTAAKPDNAANLVQGVVREIAYRGDLSTYRIDLPSQKSVRATVPNVDRLAGPAVDVGQDAWLSWSLSAPVVLTK